jgi:hypothetical protein
MNEGGGATVCAACFLSCAQGGDPLAPAWAYPWGICRWNISAGSLRVLFPEVPKCTADGCCGSGRRFLGNACFLNACLAVNVLSGFHCMTMTFAFRVL